MVVNLVFIKIFRKWRTIDIDMRNEFLIFIIPEMFHRIVCDHLSNLAPFFLFLREKFNVIVQGN